MTTVVGTVSTLDDIVVIPPGLSDLMTAAVNSAVTASGAAVTASSASAAAVAAASSVSTNATTASNASATAVAAAASANSSATTATTQATNAANSAASILGAVTTCTTQAANALTYANNAQASATAAQGYAALLGSGTITSVAGVGGTAGNVPTSSLNAALGTLLKANNLSDLSSAASARANLGIDNYTGYGDAAQTVAATVRVAGLTATLTAGRTWTIPAPSAVNPGQYLLNLDLVGGISSANPLTLSPSSGTINGASTLVLSSPYAGIELTSDGISKWSFPVNPIAAGGTGGSTVAAAAAALGFLQITNNLSELTATATTARSNISAAKSGANTDITSITGTVNGLTVTSSTGTLTIAAAKTLTANNSITLAGTDATTMTFPATTDTVAGLTATQTMTNKRVTLRIGTAASPSPVAINSDNYDQYNVTALAAAVTISAPTGTPTDGQKLMIRIKDNATARALTWTTSAGGFRAQGVALPTTTVISTPLYVGGIWNAQDGYWDVLAVS